MDGGIDRLDGALMLLGFIGFNLMLYRLARNEQDERDRLLADLDQAPSPSRDRGRELFWLLLGIAALVFGARMMVEGAVNLARLLGVSDLVIAITLVAFGTSLPELAASLSAAYHRETDLAIGNVVGSNIANLLLILGLTALLQPIAVRRAEVLLEFLVMIAFAVLLLPFLRHHWLGRRQSALFLGAYIAFIIYSFVAGNVNPLPN